MNTNSSKTIIRVCSQLKNLKNGSSQLNDSHKKIIHLNFGDEILNKTMLSVKSKRMRHKTDLIMLEGKRLLRDSLRAGVQPVKIFFSRQDALDHLPLDESVQIFKAPYKDLKLWSDLVTPPGLIAICKKPEPLPENESSLPVTIICDQIREPGNLGAMIRCAAGAGVKKVLLTEGCADLWESKVLRGAAGAHFRLPIHCNYSWADITKQLPRHCNFLLATNSSYPHLNEEKENLPVLPYFNVNFRTAENTVIVVGGETEGLSNRSLCLARELQGKAINIPLTNDIESLNCVAALSVILFEIKRQLLYS